MPQKLSADTAAPPTLARDNPRSAGRAYEYLAALEAHLHSNPQDHAARLATSVEYVRLGLGHAACGVLDGGGVSFANEAGVRALRKQAAAHSGRVIWGRRRERFEANLAVLATRGLAVEAIRESWMTARERIELYADHDGVEHVRVAGAWWPRLAEHARAAQCAPPPVDHAQLLPGPYLFDEIEHGWYLERIWKGSRNTFLGYDAAILVCVRYPAALALALHLHDWQALLRDPATHWFVGADAVEQMQKALRTDADLPLPRFLFCGTRFPGEHGNGAPVGAGVRAAAREREVRTEDSLRQVEQIYAGRDANCWRRRFEEALAPAGKSVEETAVGGCATSAQPLRILATTSSHTTFLQYSMRDSLRAFGQLGCATRLIIETRPYEIIGAETYHRHIAEFQPDLFFVLDHLRSSFTGKLPAGLPLMTWDQDALPHLINVETLRRMGPLDTVVGLSQAELVARGGVDPSAFLAVQMPASPGQFDASQLTDADLTPYRCDVSYVSHASQTAEQFHAAERENYADDNAIRLLDALLPLCIAHVSKNGPVHGGTQRALLAEGERRSGVRVIDPAQRQRFINWTIWRLCDRVFRHQTLEWVANWARRTGRRFRIYGNGWEKHPTLAEFAAGAAQNGRELLHVYRASAINLQLMPAGFLHQRALDGMSAGGFFLTRETVADRQIPVLLEAWRAIERVGIQRASDISACGDATLRECFGNAHMFLGFNDDEGESTFEFLRTYSLLDHAAEVFEDFDEIAFRDAAGFEAAADRFLSLPAGRAAIGGRMRDVVLQRYSYRAAMERFLRHACDHFARKAAAGTS